MSSFRGRRALFYRGRPWKWGGTAARGQRQAGRLLHAHARTHMHMYMSHVHVRSATNQFNQQGGKNWDIYRLTLLASRRRLLHRAVLFLVVLYIASVASVL